MGSDSTLREEAPGNAALEASDSRVWVIASPERAQVGSEWPLTRDEAFLLGRKLERGGLCLNDPKLSRLHARIAWDGRARAFRVADADSANGTFLDGVRVRVAALKHGSVLRLGGSVLVFGTHDPVREYAERIERAARGEVTIVLSGQSGTGKELAARRIHELSGRSGAFVAVNCAGFSRELLASELFGHGRGAFSGAIAERVGLFRAADGGTLFLDEVGDLPLELQPALLRALQERKVRPLGTEREISVDVRVISATHRDLRSATANGDFRLDLHGRLAQVEIALPSLSERSHTLPLLIDELSRAQNMSVEVTPSAMETMALAPWSQNIRELQSLLSRLKVFGSAPHVLSLDFISREAPQLLVSYPSDRGEGSVNLAPEIAAMSRERLESALARRGSKVSDAARDLGVSRMQVYRWLKRFGLETPARRAD